VKRSAAGAFVLFAALAGLVALIRDRPAAPLADAIGVEDVVLLHGLGRTDRAMRPLEDALTRAGYRVHNLRYPSLAKEPDELVALLVVQIEACCARAERLHFVTHSLGGLLTRAGFPPAAREPRPRRDARAA
jgi:triacylglycerol esterase/lipase EstA (alpha/beta hydrolase family)